MADRFQNGLHLTTPTGQASQAGRTFSRWLVEFLTQVCGWTIVQAVAGNWTNVVASGSSGASVTGFPRRFNITSGHAFTSTDVGAYLTITGFAGRYASRNGIYRIERIISSTVVELEVERCMHEDGFPRSLTGLSWRLWRATTDYVPTSTNVIVLKGHGTVGSGYDFHLHINVRATNCYFPEFRISPWAGWVPGVGWSDGRVISATGMDSYSSSLSGTDDVSVWAAADADRVVWMMRTENDYYSWHFGYLGEMDPQEAASDPRPCVIWTGSNAGASGPGDDLDTLIGYGSVGTILSGGKWLSFDDTTTVAGYAMIAGVLATSDVGIVTATERRWNEEARSRILQPILCECRTTGYQEVRGTLRRVWTTCRAAQVNEVQGVNGEYLHTKGGIVLPWFNTKAWYGRG